nr:metallopeptidase, catalytic domain-containing protein [Tanacetum cinerariifolium]
MASRVNFVCVLFFLILSKPAIGKHLKAVSHYSFFEGNPTPRWPVGKTHLTYAFDLNFQDSFVPPVVSSFDEWASGSGYFTFSKVADISASDLNISFERLSHGHSSAFDGPNGVLAHAFAPTDGRLHFDADENWSLGPVPDPNAFDFKSVALDIYLGCIIAKIQKLSCSILSIVERES